MSHPSMRNRLLAGTGLAVTAVLLVSMVLIYQSVARMLRKEVRMQLIESAALLAKSSELEPGGVVYEWHEALESGTPTGVPGYFQFWDRKTGHTVASPALGEGSLEPFHGDLDRIVLRPITLPDGRPAMAAGLLHHPFLDDEAQAEMERLGKILRPQDFPQVLVCARETQSLAAKLARMKWHLVRAGTATLLAIWIAVGLVSRRTLKPINALARRLDERSRQDQGAIPPTPDDLPMELTGLAGAFNRTLERVEAARERESQFALHAAHELRTPIAGIQATLEQAVSRPREAEDLRRRIDSALGIAKAMGTTIHSLMRLARVRGGIERPQNQEFDAAAAVSEMIEGMAERFAGRGLRLARLGPERDVLLTSDPSQFHLVVSTLLDNVARHAPQGSEVTAEVSRAADRFELHLTNPAPDLATEELPGLVAPFQRGRQVATADGAGLGLSLAHEVARLLEGELELRIDSEGLLHAVLTLPLGIA
jgi:signal transduction histidine kinase